MWHEGATQAQVLDLKGVYDYGKARNGRVASTFLAHDVRGHISASQLKSVCIWMGHGR